MNGYTLYAKFQLKMLGDFFNHLFLAISIADKGNLAKMEKGFPGCVEAYKVWTREGQDAFLAKAPDNCPFVAKFLSVY